MLFLLERLPLEILTLMMKMMIKMMKIGDDDGYPVMKVSFRAASFRNFDCNDEDEDEDDESWR